MDVKANSDRDPMTLKAILRDGLVRSGRDRFILDLQNNHERIKYLERRLLGLHLGLDHSSQTALLAQGFCKEIARLQARQKTLWKKIDGVNP